MNISKNNKINVGILTVFTLIFFYRIFLFGDVLSGSDILLHWYYPWKAISDVYKTSPARPMNPELSDPVFGHVPGAKFSVDALKKAAMPFWNPYRMCGSAQYADGTFAVFYPFNLLFFLPGIQFFWALTLKPIIELILFGLFTLFFAQKIGMRNSSSLFVATVAMFSFSTIVWLEYDTFLDAQMWYPLALLIFEDFIIRRRLRNLFFSVLVCSLIFLSHNPKPTSYFVQFFSIYVISRLMFLKNIPFGKKTKLMAMGLLFLLISCSVAGAVASVQIIPMLKSISLSPRQFANFGVSLSTILLSIRTSLDPVSVMRVLHCLPLTSVSFVVPKFFGWPADLKLWSPLVYSEYIFYVGIITLIFCIISLSFWKNYFVKFFFLLVAICLSLTLYIPVIYPLYASLIPGAYAGQIRLLFISAFGLAVLSGFGLEHIISLREKGDVRIFSRYASMCRLLLIISVLSGIFILSFRKPFYNFIVSTKFLGIQVFFEEVRAGGGEVAQMVFSKKELSRYEFFNFMILSFALLLCYAFFRLCKRLSIKNNTLSIIASVFVFIDLSIIALQYNPAVPVSSAYPITQTIKFLQSDKDLFRITRFGDNNVFPSGAAGFFGIYDSDGRSMSISSTESIEFYNLIEKGRGNKAIIFPIKNPATLDSPLLDLSNVKYIISSVYIPGLDRGLAQSGYTYFDFFEHLNEAKIIAPKDYVFSSVFAGRDSNQVVVAANPPSDIRFKLTVPPGSEFITDIGIREDAWQHKESDGAIFNILIKDSESLETLYSAYLNPRQNASDRQWRQVSLSLDKYSAKPVEFILKTSCGPKNNCAYDWAGWSNPRIILPARPFEASDFMKRNPLVWNKEGVLIYENKNYLPRAFIVHKSRVVKDKAKMAELMSDKNFNPRQEIILYEAGEEIAFQNAHSSADIEKYSNNYVKISAQLSHPGYLFLSDTFYPGWSAKVDGRECEIIKANYTFRAVFLQSGKHTVEFYYLPEGFNLGVKISLAGLCAVCLIGIIAYLFRDTKRTERK